MITETEGNLLEAKAESLVNAVNCVGVMGKGIALQFRRKFSEDYTGATIFKSFSFLLKFSAFLHNSAVNRQDKKTNSIFDNLKK